MAVVHMDITVIPEHFYEKLYSIHPHKKKNSIRI
jgi:hypothetical protein